MEIGLLYDLKRVTARRFASLQNLVALASLAWALLEAYRDQGQVLLGQAKREKLKPPRFAFYSLSLGWQRLFAGARTIFYDRWRRSPKPLEPDTPLVTDLFAQSDSLVPPGG